MPAIQLENVLHRYGATVALRDLSLTVEEGEVFSLLGHNGAGKTTTVRIINGLLAPASGSVRVFGLSPLVDGATVRRRTAVLTESPTLDDRLTARETLRAFAEMYDVPAQDVATRTDAVRHTGCISISQPAAGPINPASFSIDTARAQGGVRWLIPFEAS